jgi:hypothetical protein
MGKVLISDLICEVLYNSEAQPKSYGTHGSPLGCQNIHSACAESLLGLLKISASGKVWFGSLRVPKVAQCADDLRRTSSVLTEDKEERQKP